MELKKFEMKKKKKKVIARIKRDRVQRRHGGGCPRPHQQEGGGLQREFKYPLLYEMFLNITLLCVLICLVCFFAVDSSTRVVTLTKKVVLGSISPKVYEQLLYAQIPRAQKDSQIVSLFCALGICGRKSCS